MSPNKSSAGVGSRVCATRVLAAVFRGQALTEALNHSCVAANDPAFVQAIAYGVLRQHPRYPRLLEHLLDKPLKLGDQDVHCLLQAALYQLEGMRVPPHAAVNTSVQAARRLKKPWAAALVNAVLRRFQREGASLVAALEQETEVRYALPVWMIGQLQSDWPDDWSGLASSLGQQAPLWLRVNQGQQSRKDYVARLVKKGLTARPYRGAGLSSALVLDQAVAVEMLPGFAEGAVSVQDAGAQLATELLAPQPGDLVLDACAAPGGKSCHLLEYAQGIRLVAVDNSAERLLRVSDNLNRLGLVAECYQGDACAPAGEWSQLAYDRILLDAPCSATGVIRRHPDIKLLRRESDLPALVKTQRQALAVLWALLKPGGRLLYATCSLLSLENEAVVAAFLSQHAEAKELPIEADWGVARRHGRQSLPSRDPMDGFYYALLEKTI